MDNRIIDGVGITSLKIIASPGGHVLHGLKATENDFNGFGEAYFSIVEYGSIKAWRRHNKMTLNLVVPVGRIHFAIYDDRDDSGTKGCFQSIEMSQNNYKRLYIPPMLWLGFKGCDEGLNMLLNIANIPHDPDESDHINQDQLTYDWG